MTWRPPSRPRRDPAPPPSPEETATTDAARKERLEAFVAGISVGASERGVIEGGARSVFDEFAAAGVDALLLKGAALLHLLYEPGEYRAYTDIDILVAPDRFDEAARILRELGYRNATERLGIVDVGHEVHAQTWLAPPESTAREIDLHRWLPEAAATPADAWAALWRHHTTIELSGRQIPVLDRSGQALHLATHAAQHGADFTKGLIELRLAIEQWPREVWQGASELARELGAVAAFATGLRLTTEGTDLAAELELPAEHGREWELAHRGERPRGASHVAAMSRGTSLGDRLTIVRHALFPTRRWIEVEYHWAQRGPLLLGLAYLLHIVRAPIWAARAWAFARRPHE